MKYISDSLVDAMMNRGTSKEKIEELNNFIQTCQNNKLEDNNYFAERDELHKEADWLIYKYNQLLQDNDIKQKDHVRDWFYGMTQPLMARGIQSFNFLYCESILPAETLKEVYHISDEDDKKYREKYSNLHWFDEMKKEYGN